MKQKQRICTFFVDDSCYGVEVLRVQEAEGVSRMEAIKAVAKRAGLPKREVYRLFSEPGSNRRGKSRD